MQQMKCIYIFKLLLEGKTESLQVKLKMLPNRNNIGSNLREKNVAANQPGVVSITTSK